MSANNRNRRGLGDEHERTYANVQEVDSHFGCYEHLRGLPRAQEALQKLRKIASLVKPIMRKRGWRIGSLTEFLPEDTRLLGLNINRTDKICIRLRYTPDPSQFLPTETVVDTMLHELSHVVHGPHDAKFHGLWNELRDEHFSLSMKGYTGEGFLGQGRKLGGRRMPLSEMSRQARANAAQKRSTSSQDAGGRRLGGATVMRGADMRNVIANAATRRNTITQGCASGSKDSQKLADQASQNGFRTKAEEDDANDRAIAQALMELMEEEESRRMDSENNRGPSTGLGWSPETGLYINDGPDETPTGASDTDPRKTHDADSRNGRPVSRLVLEAEAQTAKTVKQSTGSSSGGINSGRDAASAARLSRHGPMPIVPSQSSGPETWVCQLCTLENPTQFLCCDACGMERPTAADGLTKQNSAYEEASKITSSPGKARAGQREVNPTSSIGWSCPRCNSFMEHKWWSCSRCGRIKDSS
ncbi:MAG: hypothetical protein M1820_007264 [Bogoriella megaspora]|nr:MAG: hypothetical protein M1820_007264 [Bogoriella megaspora]